MDHVRFPRSVARHDALTLVLGAGLISALSSSSVGVSIVALTESLRKDVRSTGLAVVYAIGVAVFVRAPTPATLSPALHAAGD